jgi:hypothetical protein
MKSRFMLALLPAVCLCRPAIQIHAQNSTGVTISAQPSSAQSKPEANGAHASGRIAGILKDPTAAVVSGATIEIENRASRFHRSIVTNGEGRFAFDNLPAGNYQVTVTAKGFDVAYLHDLAVTAGNETAANVALKIAPAKTSVEVNENPSATTSTYLLNVEDSDQARSRNAAELAGDAPGISLRDNGQLASVPLLHGLGDERAKLVVDGMTVSSACANHMNPPLSYVALSSVSEILVMAGITPVSMGGDSIGGTITVESRQPVFAGGNEQLHEEGAFTGFYRSNGKNYGGSLTEWISGRKLALGYAGSWTTNDDYTDGSGTRSLPPMRKAPTTQLTARGCEEPESLLHRRGRLASHTPYQGFPNAQMDMVRNDAESLNLHYHRRH